ncbi:hypothetical protein Trydic_g15274 [Trypoxylus dichotomus]
MKAEGGGEGKRVNLIETVVVVSANRSSHEFTSPRDEKCDQIVKEDGEHNETELNEWIDGDDDLLPLHSDDNVSNDETVIDERKVKHDEAISSFNICIKRAEENGAELGVLHKFRLM